MSGETKRVGDWGEALTAEYLRGKGYHILDSGFRCQEGEIDLIAQKGAPWPSAGGQTGRRAPLQRRSGGGEPAQTAQNPPPQRFHYLAQHPEVPHKSRFDVADILAPQGVQTQRPALRYLENAFAYDPSNLTEPGGS